MLTLRKRTLTFRGAISMLQKELRLLLVLVGLFATSVLLSRTLFRLRI